MKKSDRIGRFTTASLRFVVCGLLYSFALHPAAAVNRERIELSPAPTFSFSSDLSLFNSPLVDQPACGLPGAPDPTFSSNGLDATDVRPAANDLAIQPDGKIVAVGSENDRLYVVRYDLDGSPDETFDSDGIALLDGIRFTLPDLAIQSDGKIVVAGHYLSTSKFIRVARFNTDGSLDTSFGSLGTVSTEFGLGADYPGAVAIQPDGKIVVAGSRSMAGTSHDFAVVRYLPNGSLDNSFSGDGILTTDFQSSFDRAYDVAVQSDGKIVAAGVARSSASGDDFAVARYDSNGVLDPTFGPGGKVTVPVGAGTEGDQADSLKLQPDGKILAAGSVYVQGLDREFALVRLNSDGSPNQSFGTGGRIITPFTTSNDIANSVAVQSDGRILVFGFAAPFDSVPTRSLAGVRYNGDGSLDTTFGSGGKLVNPLFAGEGGMDGANSVEVQSDGRIVVAGLARVSGPYDFGVARFTSSRCSRDIAVSQPTDTWLRDGASTIDFGPSNGGTGISKTFTIRNDGTESMTIGGITVDGTNSAEFTVDSSATAASLESNASTTFTVIFKPVGTGVRTAMLRIASDVSFEHPFDISLRGRKPSSYDQNNDGLADLMIWRPSNNTFYMQTSAGFSFRTLGQEADLPAPADYDGDGDIDLAVFRQINASWHVATSETVETFTFGQGGDIPVPVDRNADSISEAAIYRPSTGQWLVRVSPNQSSGIVIGGPGDKPVRGDFDGDGRFDPAVYNPSTYIWRVEKTTGGQLLVTWGDDDDLPVPADYDADGITDIAVWRPSTGRWYIIGSSSGWDTRFTWGEPGDKPVPADYDGDGKADVAVWRPSTGTWYVINSSNLSFYVRQFGQDGDIPVPNAYIY
jgi:uncharacterized delta-60 repeat protein